MFSVKMAAQHWPPQTVSVNACAQAASQASTVRHRSRPIRVLATRAKMVVNASTSTMANALGKTLFDSKYCDEFNLSFICLPILKNSQCPPTFTGPNCESQVIVTTTQGYFNPCASNPCQNGGQCINQYNGQCTW
jgi:hypothetical protein